MTETPPTRPRAIKYNPAFLEDDDLVRSFVVRNVEHQLVLEDVRDNDSKPNMHVLVVGPRGSGKTSLLRRVKISIERDPDLCQLWFPIVFAEESYQVTSVGELWLEALLHLARQTDDPGLQKSHQELNRESDDDRLRERALAQLLDFADAHGRRLLLVVENFQMLTEQIRDDDAWKIRHTLQGEHRIMFLASATTRFEAIDSTSKAFYELFKVHDLRPLDLDECHLVWTTVSGKDTPRTQVRPIQILTGGNLRLMTIIARFGAGYSFDALLAELMSLVDEHTEYFKSHLDGMAVTERKVYLALAEAWAPATASEVASAARIDVHRASALLGRLVGRGAVMVAAEGKRKSYQLTERLYNIYYLMRRHGSPSHRVKAAVSFMVGYYGPRQLMEIAINLARDACRPGDPLHAEHASAYSLILSSSELEPRFRERILRATPEPFFESPHVPASVRSDRSLAQERHTKDRRQFPPGDSQKTADLLDELTGATEEDLVICREVVLAEPTNAGAWARLGHLLASGENSEKEAEASFRAALGIDPTYAWAWARMGQLLDHIGKYAEAEQALRQAVEIEPEYSYGWFQLARLLMSKLAQHEAAVWSLRNAVRVDPEFGTAWFDLVQLLLFLDRFDEAEQVCHEVIESNRLKSAPSWLLLAQLLHERPERSDEAEAAYRKSIELDPESFLTWAKFGQLLHEVLGRSDEAEVAYRKSVELKSDYAWAWVQLGELLHKASGRGKEAELAYRKAIELDKYYGWAWAELGELLHEVLGRYGEAEVAYRQAIELAPENSWMWGQLGQLLHEEFGRYDEAEAAYRKAIELDGDYAWTWAQLGQLLREPFGRHEEAEAAFRKAIELRPEESWGWAQLGELLDEEFGRYDEAEAAYRKVIELDGRVAWAWARLGQLLHEGFGRHEEAEATYRKAIELDGDYAWTWVQLGQLLQDGLGRSKEAEAAYRKAIELEENYTWAWAKLAQLLREDLGRIDESEAAYRKAITIESNNPWLWTELGRLLHEAFGRNDEAEAVYRKALELQADYAWAWAQLGQLFHDVPGRDAEAETAYRKALTLEEKDAWIWTQLGQLLEQTARCGEAVSAYRMAVECDRHSFDAWVGLLRLAGSGVLPLEEVQLPLEEWLEAERDASLLNELAWTIFCHGPANLLSLAQGWADTAVELSPDDTFIAHTHAAILAALGQVDEAITAIAPCLSHPDAVRMMLSHMVELFVDLAARGAGQWAHAALLKSSSAELLEGLLVALALDADLPTAASPVEIVELAQDIRRDIEARRAALGPLANT